MYKGVEIILNRHDTIVWLKLDKVFFKLETDIYLSGVYLWGENSPAYNVVNVDLFDLLQQDIEHFQSRGRVLLVGDWNSRIGSKRDYIACDRLVNFIDCDDYIPDLPHARNTNDSVCNSHGFKLLDLCKATSLRVANGRLGHDTGSVTFLSQVGQSVIDYLLLNEQDFHCIDNFNVDQFCEWSDHCSLSFTIKTCCNTHTHCT